MRLGAGFLGPRVSHVAQIYRVPSTCQVLTELTLFVEETDNK